jgi:hypothetical protein
MSQKTERQSEVSAPNIVEAYRDYVPPQSVRPIIEDLLKTVPPRYLVGLQSIILTNQTLQRIGAISCGGVLLKLTIGI